MTKSRIAMTAALSCAVLALAACQGSSSNSSGAGGPTHDGGDLTFARPLDIETLNTTEMTDNTSVWTAENIFDTLYVTSADGKSVEPSLATGHTVSPDHLTWTFDLRKNVTFSDGTPLTAKDVKFSIEQVSAKDSHPFASTNKIISSIETPDDYTVVIKTSSPWAPLLSDMALFANSIVPAGYGGKSEADFFEHPIGSGPFILDRWTKGTEVRLVKNPRYWKAGLPHLNSVTFQNVSDDNTRTLQLRSGQTDIEAFPPTSGLAQLKTVKDLEVKTFPSSRVDSLVFNTQKGPLANVNARRAISYAIDRQAIIDAVLSGDGTVAKSFLSPAMWAYDAPPDGGEHNVEKAKAALAASDNPTGFHTTIQVGSKSAAENLVAQIIQAQMKPLGIIVDLVPVDPNDEYANLQKGQYEIGFDYFTTDITDPDEWVSYTAMGGETGQQTKANFTFYDNPEVDAWAQQAQTTFDQSQRQVLYSKIQAQIAKDVPLAPLYCSPFNYAYRSNVKGFVVYPSGFYPLAEVSLG